VQQKRQSQFPLPSLFGNTGLLCFLVFSPSIFPTVLRTGHPMIEFMIGKSGIPLTIVEIRCSTCQQEPNEQHDRPIDDLPFIQ
jgi:hypothetical protein